MNEVMCACFDFRYILSDISDDGRTSSTVLRDTSQECQRFLPPISEHQLCERVSEYVVNVFPCSVYLQRMSGVVLLIPVITQAWNTVSCGIC